MNIKSVWVKILSVVCPQFSHIVSPLLDLATGPMGLEIKEGVGVVLMILHYLERRNPNATGYTKIEELITSIDGFIGITPDQFTMPDGLDVLLDKMTGIDPKPVTPVELADLAPPLPANMPVPDPSTPPPTLPDPVQAAIDAHGSVSAAKSAGAL